MLDVLRLCYGYFFCIVLGLVEFFSYLFVCDKFVVVVFEFDDDGD